MPTNAIELGNRQESFAADPKQTSWKVVYTEYDGLMARAIELLNREVGKLLIRQEGKYTLHVLPLERETASIRLEKNVFLIGCRQDSALIRKHVSQDEIPQNGYTVKVIDNPTDKSYSLVILTGNTPQCVYYAVTAFVDQYATACAPNVGGLRFKHRLFDEKLINHTLASAPKAEKRSVFAWGHPINDYRAFLQSMARQGLNQLILWNDHKPLNAKEIVDYAHAYGIELIWAFSWGWIEGCHRIQSIDEDYLKHVKAQVLDIFERDYADAGDGIYFQSFTELNSETIGGKIVAEVVTDFVNDVAGELLEKHPDLHIQFGLHANSVRNRLEPISHVDKRIEIIWENGGVFPFDKGIVRIEDEDAYQKKFEETLTFTEKILTLRGTDAPTGIMFKGFMKLDWSQFVNQSGPFLLGENAPEIQEHDKRLRRDAWRAFSADWLKNGGYAKQFCDFIHQHATQSVNLCMAGLFDGGVYLPQAICSELFWNSDRTYEDIVKAAMDKDFVITE